MRRVALALAAPAVLAACAGILGVESIHVDDVEDAALPASDAEPTDASTDVRLDAGDCPSEAGPPMVRVTLPSTSFCIDTTEVTGADYAAFLATSPAPAAQPAVCAWNTNFLPTVAAPPDHPATGIDWCDARAFCAWAGKRLCGAIQPGGPLDPERITSAVDSQLFAACSRGGTTVFPYGSGYEPEACNAGLTDGGGGVEAVRARPKCVGGAPGVYDLLGNVWEWVDACKGSDGGPLTESGDHAKDFCFFYGGAYGNEATRGCQFYSGFARNYRADDLGFRCCAP